MSTIKLFETKQVPTLWDAEKEAWFFSILDVSAVLPDSADSADSADTEQLLRLIQSTPSPLTALT